MYSTRLAVLVCLLSPPATTAQTPTSSGSPAAVIQALFTAMKAADTAAARAVFAANARVIPAGSGVSAQMAGQGMSVDQFVGFVGKNPPGGWVERMWQPTERVSGVLADVWFDYDVYHGATFDHCGVNAVQLQQTPTGWKIIAMTFTSAVQGCASHAPPTDLR